MPKTVVVLYGSITAPLMILKSVDVGKKNVVQ